MDRLVSGVDEKDLFRGSDEAGVGRQEIRFPYVGIDLGTACSRQGLPLLVDQFCRFVHCRFHVSEQGGHLAGAADAGDMPLVVDIDVKGGRCLGQAWHTQDLPCDGNEKAGPRGDFDLPHGDDKMRDLQRKQQDR